MRRDSLAKLHPTTFNKEPSCTVVGVIALVFAPLESPPHLALRLIINSPLQASVAGEEALHRRPSSGSEAPEVMWAARRKNRVRLWSSRG